MILTNMAKINILFLILLFIVSVNLYALGDFTGNALIQFIYFEDIVKEKGILFGSFVYTSMTLGIGYHFNIVPDIFTPGIYGEAGFSFLTILFSHEGVESNTNSDYGFLILGIRLYNQFKSDFFCMRPFAGLRMFLESNKDKTRTVECVYFGMQLIYKKLIIEYSYNISYKYPSERVYNIGFGYNF